MSTVCKRVQFPSCVRIFQTLPAWVYPEISSNHVGYTGQYSLSLNFDISIGATYLRETRNMIVNAI